MEAIHPKAAKPLELADINIRIKNTFQPHHPGTLISRDYVSPEPRVEIVSGSRKVMINQKILKFIHILIMMVFAQVQYYLHS